MQALIYGLNKTKGQTSYNDRLKFIRELGFDESLLIKQGVVDCNLFIK